LPGDVQNSYGLSHIQDKNFSAFAEGGTLQDEAGGFGDGHEVTGGLGVCDSERASFVNLFTEDGDDTAGRAEYIAESYGHEMSLVFFGRLAGHDAHFRQAFGGSHDAGGVDGFVGRD